MTFFAYALSVLGMLILPIILSILLRRRYPVLWILFTVGCLTFLGSQAVHLPLNEWLADIGILPKAPNLADGPLWRSAIILGLTAGLCEELARAVGYLVVRWARRFEDGLMLGLGHGGIEAMVFGGVLTAATISSLLNLQGVDLETLNLSSAQMEILTLQLEQFTATPLYALAPFIERTIAIGAHVLFSILVLLAFTQKKPFYILIAIAYHALVDAVAVYVVVTTQSIWLSWSSFLIILLPGWIWLYRLWSMRNRELTLTYQREPPAEALFLGLRRFLANLQKELLYQWRTYRVVIVCAVLIAFGIISPLLTKFTPQLLSAIEGAEMFAELVPEMTMVDSMSQHIETITQFGFILVILLGMGAVAGEKESGTAGMVLSKPLSRSTFLNSKFTAQSILLLLAMALTTAVGYYYTVNLFGKLDFDIFLKLNALLLLWLLVLTAITLLGSTLGNSTGAGAGFALGGSILLLLAGSLPRIGALLPAGLLAWAGQIASQIDSSSNWGAVAMAFVIIILCLVAALGIFEQQELK